MTGDQINNAIEAALPMLDEKARKALTFTRWHDGIDIEYPTVGCRGFVAAILLHLTGQLTDGVPVPQTPKENDLIENGKQQGAGLAYRYIDNASGGIPGWTVDPNEALRFARRADAEQYVHHDEDAWRIVEHGWLAGECRGPVLCDNNLSGLDAAYQAHIIERYRAAGVQLRDANSGFEPKTFTPDVYERWRALVNEGGGPWRFAYDDMPERADVLRVMRMLADEPAKRKRVYVLIGNEPFAECMQRIQEVIDGGCEPHVQPVMKLNALERRPWVRHDWTERKLKDVARWANGFVWRSTPFAEYDRTRKNSKKAAAPRYDAHTGLFTFAEEA